MLRMLPICGYGGQTDGRWNSRSPKQGAAQTSHMPSRPAGHVTRLPRHGTVPGKIAQNTPSTASERVSEEVPGMPSALSRVNEEESQWRGRKAKGRERCGTPRCSTVPSARQRQLRRGQNSVLQGPPPSSIDARSRTLHWRFFVLRREHSLQSFLPHARTQTHIRCSSSWMHLSTPGAAVTHRGAPWCRHMARSPPIPVPSSPCGSSSPYGGARACRGSPQDAQSRVECRASNLYTARGDAQGRQAAQPNPAQPSPVDQPKVPLNEFCSPSNLLTSYCCFARNSRCCFLGAQSVGRNTAEGHGLQPTRERGRCSARHRESAACTARRRCT